MKGLNKNEQVIAYLTQKHPEAGITVLMKLCYLIDLISFKKNNKSILDFDYIRYKYGPFDEKIYNEVNSLREKAILSECSDYTATGKEYTYYTYTSDEALELSNVDKSELQIIDEVLELVKGHGAKALTEICYKTQPMRALGATLGGDENLYVKLDFSTVNPSK